MTPASSNTSPLESFATSVRQDWVRVALICIYGFVVLKVFQDGVPVGRDWFRYWLPYIEYFSRNGPTYGVLWQLGAATLPIYDPSTFLFDPVYLLILKTVPFPLNAKIYILLIWAVGMLSMERLLFRFEVKNAFRFGATLGYSFGGLAISVLVEQLIPFYFILPLAALCFVSVCENNGLKEKIHFSLALYFLGYNAVPSVFIFSIFGFLWALPKRHQRIILIRGLLYSSIALAFPYTALVYSKIQSAAPDSFLGQWPFHPARVVSFFLPEFFAVHSKSIYWINHALGKNGFGEPYFRSIALPLSAFLGLWILFMKDFRTEPQFQVLRRMVALAIAALLCAMVGLLPLEWHSFIAKIPFFIGRYHEKYLLLATPILIVCSAYLLTKATPKKRALAAILHLSFIVGCFFTTSYFYPALYSTFKVYTTLVYILLSSQFCMILAGAVLFRHTKVMVFLFATSSLFYLPVAISNLEATVQNLDHYAQSPQAGAEWSFLKAYGKLLERQFIYIHPDAHMLNCLTKNQSGSNSTHCGQYLSGSWLGFMSYLTHGGYTSFFGLREAYDAEPSDYIENIKPRYVIVTKDTNSVAFCHELIRTRRSIIDCKPLASPADYQGELRILEIKHMNELRVLSDGDPYQLDLAVKARFNQVRLPFMLPPGGTVTLDGSEVTPTADTYGIVVALTGANQSKGYSEHKISIQYHGRVLKVALAIALSLALAVLLIEIKCRGFFEQVKNRA